MGLRTKSASEEERPSRGEEGSDKAESERVSSLSRADLQEETM